MAPLPGSRAGRAAAKACGSVTHSGVCSRGRECFAVELMYTGGNERRSPPPPAARSTGAPADAELTGRWMQVRPAGPPSSSCLHAPASILPLVQPAPSFQTDRWVLKFILLTVA